MAQNNESPISVKSHYSNGEVRLRWFVNDADLWATANEVGYTIERMTFTSNGNPLNYADSEDSKVTLVTNYMPKSESEFDSGNLAQNTFAQNAKELLYNDDFRNDPLQTQDVSLEAAVMAHEKKDTRHFFSMMTAEMDFEAACALGMAYIDNTIEPNKEYIYTISISQDDTTVSNVIDEEYFDGIILEDGSIEQPTDPFGIWNKENSGTSIYKSLIHVSGHHGLRLRNGIESSMTYTNDLAVGNYQDLKLSFYLTPFKLSDGESLDIEISYDGGSTYEIIHTLTLGVELTHNLRQFHELTSTLSNPTDNVRIRMQAHGSANNESFNFDDFKISASQNAIDFIEIDFNNFDDGFGIWNDGGHHCLIFDVPYANSPINCLLFRNNIGAVTTDNLDLTGVSQLQFSLSAYSTSFEDGEYFELFYSSDEGATFESIQKWVAGTDFNNGIRLSEIVEFENVEFNESCQLRIEAHASDNQDRLYLDDLQIISISGVEEDNSDPIIAHEMTDTDEDQSLAEVNLLEVVGAENQATVKWDITGDASNYTSYNIERSEDNVNFQKVNDIPYVFATTESKRPDAATFKDILPDNTTTYYYRVCGKSSFGYTGPPSNVIEVVGVSPKLTYEGIINDELVTREYSTRIDSFSHDGANDNVILHWSELPASIASEVTGFDIYKSKNIDGPYGKLTDNPIAGNSTSYIDTDPANAAYYMMTAYDQNAHEYPSLPEMVQLPDSIPPAVPNINQNISVDSIFICVRAEDHRQNQSEESMPIGMPRPDIHGPNAPLLSSVNSTPDGIAIKWQYSASSDASKHVLQRKMTDSPNWVDLVTIKSGDEDDYTTDGSEPSYIDSAFVDITQYEYRLIVHDDAFNQSSSKPFKITPNKKMVTDERIENLEINMQTENVYTDPYVEAQLASLSKAGWDIGRYKSLDYDYPTSKSSRFTEPCREVI